MAKKQKRYFLLYPGNKRFYGEGGTLLEKMNQNSDEAWKNATKGENLGNTLGAVGSGISGIASGIMDAYDKTSAIDDTAIEQYQDNIEELDNTNFSQNDSYDSLLDQWQGIDFQKTDWSGTDFRQSAASATGQAMSGIGQATMSGASAGAQVGGVWGAIIGGAAGLLGSTGAAIGGYQNARKESDAAAARLNREAEEANTKAINNMNRQASAITDASYQNMRQNIMAEGGKIHIKPENRGKFTALKKRTGKSASWFKEHGTPAQRKMATFALNARKWSHKKSGEEPYEPSLLRRQKYNIAHNSLGQANSNGLLAGLFGITPSYETLNYKYPIEEWEKFKDSGGYGYTGFMNTNSDYNYPFSHTTDKNIPYMIVWRDDSKFNKIEDPEPLIIQKDDKIDTIGNPNYYYEEEIYPKDTVYINRKAKPIIDAYKDIALRGSTDGFIGKKYNKNIVDAKNTTVSIKDGYIRLSDYWDVPYLFTKRKYDNIPTFIDQVPIKYHNAPTDSTFYQLLLPEKDRDGNPTNVEDKSVVEFMNKLMEIDKKEKQNNHKNSNGGNLFTNGVTTVNNGDTHEENPMEGVPMGIAPDGLPNLVEEGETIYNDYVFSNRIKAPKELKKRLKLTGNTFSDIAKSAQKESEERPNDPISKRGLDDIMNKLQVAQEAIKQIEQTKQMRKYAKGGRLAHKFNDGGGSFDIEKFRDSIIYGKNKTAPKSDFEADLRNLDTEGWDRLNSLLLANPEWTPEQAMNYMNARNPDTGDTGDTDTLLPTWMRYAAAAGPAIGAIASLATPPDYSNSDILINAANNLSQDRVRFRPINNYLTYRPIDRNYQLNELRSQAGATRRSIMNSGSNAGQTMAGLLAADYNAQRGIGDALTKMEMYNEQNRQRVADFNRQTAMYNSQGRMQASQANAGLATQRDKLRLSALGPAAQMREATDTARLNSIYGNVSGMFENLGNIGNENFVFNQINSNDAWRYKLPTTGGLGYKGAKGGKLLTKRRRKH